VAQKVVHEFIDDIDGSAAERTFTFAVDGTAYEIELSSANIAEFQSAIGGFIESARKVRATSNGQRQRGASPTDAMKERGLRSRESRGTLGVLTSHDEGGPCERRVRRSAGCRY
jgi:hypothetical protein